MKKHSFTICVLIFIALCIGSIALAIDKIGLNQSPTLEQMLSAQHLLLINQHRALFPVESEPVIVALRAAQELSTQRIAEFEAALATLPEITSTLSSASLADASLMAREVFSPVENTHLILLLISSSAQQLERAKVLAANIDTAVNAHLQRGESALVVGMPHIRAESWRISRENARLILPLLLLSTAAVTLLMFGTMTALLLSLLLTSLTTCLTLLLQMSMSAQISPLSFLVIPVIWSIATLDAFHLYSAAARKARQHHRSPALAARNELLLPCLLTTVTTAGCFLTLALLDTSALIVSFGLWCAAGTIMAFALTFTVGEKILRWHEFRQVTPRWPRLFCLSLLRCGQIHARQTILFWALAVVLAALCLPRLGVATTYPQVFAAQTAIASRIDDVISLTDSDLNAFDLVLTATDLHGKKIQSLASAGLLLTNYLKTIDESRLVLPIGAVEENALGAMYSRLQSGEHLFRAGGDRSLQAWLNEDKHALRLQVLFSQTSHTRKAEIVSWLKHFDETMLSHHQIELSGAGYFHHATEAQGLRSLAASSALSLAIVTAAMLLITRGKSNVWAALAGCIVPAVVVVGVMAAFAVPWSIAMLPLPVLLLGLMNDDTIHITWSGRRSRLPYTTCVVRNAVSAGPALFATTLVLSCAIATVALSDIQSNRYLGMLIPLGLLLAFFCNLTLLPALNSLLRKSSQQQQ